MHLQNSNGERTQKCLAPHFSSASYFFFVCNDIFAIATKFNDGAKCISKHCQSFLGINHRLLIQFDRNGTKITWKYQYPHEIQANYVMLTLKCGTFHLSKHIKMVKQVHVRRKITSNADFGVIQNKRHLERCSFIFVDHA